MVGIGKLTMNICRYTFRSLFYDLPSRPLYLNTHAHTVSFSFLFPFICLPLRSPVLRCVPGRRKSHIKPKRTKALCGQNSGRHHSGRPSRLLPPAGWSFLPLLWRPNYNYKTRITGCPTKQRRKGEIKQKNPSEPGGWEGFAFTFLLAYPVSALHVARRSQNGE